MNSWKNIKLFLLDMDGTIYLDNELFDGTLDFLQYIKKTGRRALFLTNNSSKSVRKYIEKLSQMGISAGADDFVTSIDATALYLKQKNYRKIYVCGTASFLEQLRAAGLSVTNRRSDDVDCLCLGFDSELTFQKLEDACMLLGRGVDYIATNCDWVCPTQYGYVPDCGSIAQMLCNATQRRPKFIGKPEPDMIDLAMERTGFSKDETMMIGDRLYTDIACGYHAGVRTMFVLSGEGTMEDVEKSEIKPDFIAKNIREVYEGLTD